MGSPCPPRARDTPLTGERPLSVHIVDCPPTRVNPRRENRRRAGASPKSFFPHHLAAISSAIVCADARSIRNHAASLATQLSHGMI